VKTFCCRQLEGRVTVKRCARHLIDPTPCTPSTHSQIQFSSNIHRTTSCYNRNIPNPATTRHQGRFTSQHEIHMGCGDSEWEFPSFASQFFVTLTKFEKCAPECDSEAFQRVMAVSMNRTHQDLSCFAIYACFYKWNQPFSLASGVMAPYPDEELSPTG